MILAVAPSGSMILGVDDAGLNHSVPNQSHTLGQDNSMETLAPLSVSKTSAMMFYSSDWMGAMGTKYLSPIVCCGIQAQKTMQQTKDTFHLWTTKNKSGALLSD